ncbi:hypothetical protein [Candidatus Burkholderia verschuerenii]|uniref:hypothetical protein n=1 Tax=Candidatus Burkholderia verschuerenii TaxID=242163 RepID=UPI00067A89BB|nr:hypothetical protein [Candidatus Burkholderia verschuerenii]
MKLKLRTQPTASDRNQRLTTPRRKISVWISLLASAAFTLAGSAYASVTLDFGAHTKNTTGGFPGSGIAIGYMANGDTTNPGGSSPVANGANANASGFYSQVAIGDHATATGKDAVAVGGNIYNGGATATGDYSVSFGTQSTATGTGAIAIGGDGSAGASAAANNALAFGAKSKASADNAMAMGADAQAGNANDVALGANSKTAAVQATTNVTIDGVTYEVSGIDPTSTVSTGDAGSERTLTNLAAGGVDATSTDAVNGSQLNATNLAVEAQSRKTNALGNSTATALGGGATYDPSTGELTSPTYTVYGQQTTGVDNTVAALQNNAPLQYSTAAAPTTGLGANGAPVSNDVTLVGPDASAPVTLHNVAQGVGDTDGVNVAQLNSAISNAVINVLPTD